MFCFVSLCGSSISAQTDSLLVQDVSVIDSTGAPPQPHVSVLIIGGHIKSISPVSHTPTPQRGQTTLDGRGKFLIAGLWDMHVHSLSKNCSDHFLPLFIANGITGIRDMGGDIPLSQVAQIKNEIVKGSRLGPEIFAAGPILEGEHPFWPFSIAVKNESDARQAVGALVKEKADFVKVYNTLSREVYREIAASAKENHIPFEGHIPPDVTPAEASDLGQRSIEHLWGIAPYCTSSQKQLNRLSAEADSAQDANVARDL